MQSTITDESSRTAASQISAINEALAEKVGQKKFRIWFKSIRSFPATRGEPGWIRNPRSLLAGVGLDLRLD